MIIKVLFFLMCSIALLILISERISYEFSIEKKIHNLFR